MKNNKSITYTESALIAGTSRSVFSTLLTAVLAATVVLAVSAQVAQSSNNPALHTLKPGDIVYADSGNAIDGGFVIKVDPATGQQTIISCGGYLQMPFDPLIDGDGQIIVSDSGRLVRINPDTGSQQVITDNSRGTLGLPYGIALDSAGQILAANLQSVVQVDPFTSQIRTVSSRGNFVYPLGIAVAANGELFVLNMAFPAPVVRINPQNGLQKVISQGNNLIGPVGIAVEANGQLIVGDPYTVNPQSPDLADGGYDGGIIRIDPGTGQQ